MVMRCLGVQSSLIFVFVAVERFDGEYSEDGVAFEDGFFEEVMEFGMTQNYIMDFGSLHL